MWSIRSKVARANYGKKKKKIRSFRNRELRKRMELLLIHWPVKDFIQIRGYCGGRCVKGRKKKDEEKHSEKSLHINGVLPKRVNYIYTLYYHRKKGGRKEEELMYLGNWINFSNRWKRPKCAYRRNVATHKYISICYQLKDRSGGWTNIRKGRRGKRSEGIY